MISTEQNQALLTVSRTEAQYPAWADYVAYCLTRERSLRKEAFRHLTTFLAKAESWTLDQQIEFVSFLFPSFRDGGSCRLRALAPAPERASG